MVATSDGLFATRAPRGSGGLMKKGILLHEADDDVGVATMDLTAGETVEAVTLEGNPVLELEVVDDVPLAHKVAVRQMDQDEAVLEYGRPIGSARIAIARGAHVHTHNVRSQRWAGKSQLVEHEKEQS
jgi:(2R)-sulfolactate sulfo-lyase subunit alpha